MKAAVLTDTAHQHSPHQVMKSALLKRHVNVSWIQPLTMSICGVELLSGSLCSLRREELNISWLPIWSGSRSDGDVESVPLMPGRPRIVGGVLSRG